MRGGIKGSSFGYLWLMWYLGISRCQKYSSKNKISAPFAGLYCHYQLPSHALSSVRCATKSGSFNVRSFKFTFSPCSLAIILFSQARPTSEPPREGLRAHYSRGGRGEVGGHRSRPYLSKVRARQGHLLHPTDPVGRRRPDRLLYVRQVQTEEHRIFVDSTVLRCSVFVKFYRWFE